MNTSRPWSAAVLGTGNIGTDLAVKLDLSPLFALRAVAGRRQGTRGMRVATGLGAQVSANGLEGLGPVLPDLDVIFDATDSGAHAKHWVALRDFDCLVVDMTPSRIGCPTVPHVDLSRGQDVDKRNISMITCGAQASLPIIDALTQLGQPVDYVEVSSSIASRSAGPSTRINLDDYIMATEAAAKLAAGAVESKAILILSPVEPPTFMRTTIQIEFEKKVPNDWRRAIEEALGRVRLYVPGYGLAVEPFVRDQTLTCTVRVQGRGDFLPDWAGNLDIITASAVRVAEDILNGRQAP